MRVAKAQDQNGVIKCLVSAMDDTKATKPANVKAPSSQV